MLKYASVKSIQHTILPHSAIWLYIVQCVVANPALRHTVKTTMAYTEAPISHMPLESPD